MRRWYSGWPGMRVCQVDVMVDHQAVTDPSLPCCPHQPGASRSVVQRKGFLLSDPGPSLEKLQRVWRGSSQQRSFLTPAALCLLTLLHPQGPKPGHMLALRVTLVGLDSETDSCSLHLSSLMASSASLGAHTALPASCSEQQYNPGVHIGMGSGQHLSDHPLKGF